MSRRFTLVTLALTAVMVIGAACHLLDVNNPDVVPSGGLNDATALPTIRAGAIGDFGLAYTGSGAQGSHRFTSFVGRENRSRGAPS